MNMGYQKNAKKGIVQSAIRLFTSKSAICVALIVAGKILVSTSFQSSIGDMNDLWEET